MVIPSGTTLLNGQDSVGVHGKNVINKSSRNNQSPVHTFFHDQHTNIQACYEWPDCLSCPANAIQMHQTIWTVWVAIKKSSWSMKEITLIISSDKQYKVITCQSYVFEDAITLDQSGTQHESILTKTISDSWPSSDYSRNYHVNVETKVIVKTINSSCLTTI